MQVQTEQAQIQPQTVIVKRSLASKIFKRIQSTYQYDSIFWRVAIFGSWSVTILTCFILALSMPTGLGVTFDLMLFSILGTILFFGASHLLAVIIAIIGLRIPRLFISTILCNLTTLFFIFYEDDSSFLVSALTSCIVSLGGILVGLLSAMLLYSSVPRYLKYSLLTGCLLLVAVYFTFTAWCADFNNEVVDDAIDKNHVEVEIMNPAAFGNHDTSYFTYGSGINHRLTEFGAEVSLHSNSVDASEFITNWSWYRTLFWGFDQKSLPLNGRVWMPQEQGQYPLVLLVHGNHLMEDYSDEGYNYLGELLASRGFIAISIDENFLNYSTYSGIPTQDMKVRAWVLLKHLMQIQEYDTTVDNPLYNKVDMSKIAIVGHSRGGQAAAMTAGATQWFKEDQQLAKFAAQYHIQTVIAIAPTDKQVDKKYTNLENVNYLTIQGAMDGDVSDFDGERQYARTTFKQLNGNHDTYIKSTLYIEDANHSQFNTNWGSRDISLPQGLFLSRSGMLAPSDQQQIAKVYVTAFLEATLHENEDYIPLLQDYRYGELWLPSSNYFNRYEDSSFVTWSKFEDSSSYLYLSGNGKIKADHVTTYREAYKNRSLSSKNTSGLKLKWGSNTTPTNQNVNNSPTVNLHWEHGAPKPAMGSTSIISFSLADLSFQDQHESQPLEIDVEVYDLHGNTATLPLSSFMSDIDPPQTNFTWYTWMDRYVADGKYKESTEAIMQTIMLPLEAYTQINPKLDTTSLAGMTLHLKSSSGLIMIDDIGVY